MSNTDMHNPLRSAECRVCATQCVAYIPYLHGAREASTFQASNMESILDTAAVSDID